MSCADVTLGPAGPCSRRQSRGRDAQSLGLAAEQVASTALEKEGWSVLARRLRTEAGEIDIVAERDGLLAIVEVKARDNLADAAAALRPSQQARLMAAAELIVAANPGWGARGMRFDVILVDRLGRTRRVADAFRMQ